MKSLTLFAALLFVCTTQALAQTPAITAGGVTNSANNLPRGLPNSGVAQGSIFNIAGSNLGPTTLSQASYPLDIQLSGTSVQVTVGGTKVDALVISTLNSQVQALLPSTTPLGTGTVTVTYNGATSATAPIQVVATAFGIYTLNQLGAGPAAINDTTSGQAVPVTLATPAMPNDTVVLTGTGLGAYSGDETNPAAAQMDLSSTVSLFVGNQPAVVSYAGRSTTAPGQDEIDFTVPAGANGCYVPVVAVVSGIVSNFTSIAVSPDGSTCSDPSGLPSSAINQVAAGGNLKVGFIELQRIGFSATVPILGNVSIKQDRGAAYFYNFDNQALIASRGISSISSFSSCSVLVCTGSTCIPNNDALQVPRLDAGPSINITGPAGAAVLPLSSNTGEYHGALGATGLTGSNYLNPGAYTASGTGGADVGAFTANLVIPQLLNWTNPPAVAGGIDRTNGLTVNWTGGNATDYVAIVGSSSSVNSAATPQATVTFVCTEQASAGTFTVPPYVLGALPVSGTVSQSGVSLPGGFLLFGNYPLTSPITTVPGLDVAFFTHTIVSGINIAYK